MGFIAIFLGLYVARAAWIYFKRGKKAFLQIHPAGFCIPEVTEVIPWEVVEAICFNPEKQTMTVQLIADTKLVVKKCALRRTKWNKEKCLFVITACKPKGMKVQAYIDLIIAYFNAARAREIQRIRQDEKAAVKARLHE
jgi:hypothetical protein